MASKRSQVKNNLQTITANQPVARVIDTYAPAAQPALVKSNTADILNSLISFGKSQNEKIRARKKAEQEALEKQEREAIDLAFLQNPDQFATDLRLGKFKNLTSPARLLAAEHMGTRLARQYSVVLREEYEKAGLDKSDDAGAFFDFESTMRTKFIQNNGDAFTKEGVSTGFAKNFRQYIQALDSTHAQTAKTNLKTNQELGFKDAITANIDGVLNGSTSPADFGNSIRLAQNDAKLGYNFDNNTANALTTDALIAYAAGNNGLTFEQRRDVLKLGNFIQTSPGSSLSGTREASFKIGKALVEIDEAEERDKDKQTKVYKAKKLMVTDSVTAKIQAALKADPNTDLKLILSDDELKEAKEFYPSYLKDFDTYQDFFQNQSAERLSGDEEMALRMEIAESGNRAAARRLLNSMVSQKRLKGDATVFGKLVSDIQRIPADATAKARPQFTRDALYQSSFRLLGGQVTVDGSFMQGSVPPKPSVLAKLEFFNFAFQDLYLGTTLVDGKEYKDMSRIEQAAAVRALYNEAKAIE